MSSPVSKTQKGLTSRGASNRKRVVKAKSTRLKPATKRSPAGKARAHKASKAAIKKTAPKRAAAKASTKSRTVVAAKRTTKKAAPARRVSVKVAIRTIPQKPLPPPPQPTFEEAAALTS